MDSFIKFAPLGIGLFALIGLAATPWLIVALGQPRKTWWNLGVSIIGMAAVAGTGFSYYLASNPDQQFVTYAGRMLMSFLHLNIGVSLFVLLFYVLLRMGSKMAAIGLAAFQEAVRQPLFWVMTGLLALAMLFSIVQPYFTFGEDIKVVRDLCYTISSLGPLLFGVFLACTSVHEEIEGRTAVTVMSKPVHRRQFMFGKFFGLTAAAGLMTIILGWFLVWMILIKANYDPPIGQQPDPDPEWITRFVAQNFPGEARGFFSQGALLWISDSIDALPNLVIGFCQAMVMISIGVALSTRLPLVVNAITCLVVYLLGHLTPIMSEVTRNRYTLMHFVAQAFENILPGLDRFDVGSAVIRDLPLDSAGYGFYAASVAIYALIYTAIATLVGLVLFEDRDLG